MGKIRRLGGCEGDLPGEKSDIDSWVSVRFQGITHMRSCTFVVWMWKTVPIG